MAVQEILSTLVDKGTDYLIDVPLSYLQKGLGKIGLDTVGNVLVDSGKLIGGGIDKLALGLTGQGVGNFGGGLSDLYTGVDTLVGGVLPRGQDFGAGYLGQMFGQGATDGATKATSDGLLSSQDVYGKTFPDARLIDGTPIKFTQSGKLATSLAPKVTGANAFMDKAMAGAKLAGAIGTVASMFNGGGGSGGSNPTAGRAPASKRIERAGGALSASRRMSSPQANTPASAGGYGYGTGASGGISMGTGMTEAEKIEAFNSLVSSGVSPEEAKAMVERGITDPTATVVMPGTGGTTDASSIDLFSSELSKDEELLNTFEDEVRNALALRESVSETAEAVEAQEEAEGGDTKEEIVNALVGEDDASGDFGAGRYSVPLLL